VLSRRQRGRSWGFCLKSTSCKDLAQDVLDRCLAGDAPRELPRSLVSEPCGPHLFGILAEGLGDRFEPALCDDYARLFAQAIAYTREGYPPAMLVSRYERVRQVRPAVGKPHRIFVLSRVTLGAEIAVTSVLLAAAKRRFPHADLVLVGPKKNYELFAADSRIRHIGVEYRRGGLRERLGVWDELQEILSDPFALVLDPDSRLTQLGLLPVTSWERCHLFESRSYGGDSTRSLPDLASEWCGRTLGVAGARPYVALGPPAPRGNHIAVSLGVGDNPKKRLPDPFEEELLRLLAATRRPICVDRGAGGEEAERVQRAVERSGADATFWEGSFAGFASIVSGASLFVGYDSAGQHLAAACGVPLISIFAGFPAPRMFDRWRPVGYVIRVDQPDVSGTLARVGEALKTVIS
jgi:ADP-heptose:LPS heptosyltransferase